MAIYLNGLFPNHDVVAFHYRGYSPSSGRPSTQALLADSVVIFDQMSNGSPAKPIIAVGFSIGAGVAVYLARHRPIAGLILVTPFDSLEALAREHYWWAPIGLLLRHRMPTIDFIRDLPTPTAVIAAEHDRIVPARRSSPLKAAVVNLVLERTIEAGHNDLYAHPAFAEAMHQSLARIRAARTATARRDGC
jgi:uncharacterized protein